MNTIELNHFISGDRKECPDGEDVYYVAQNEEERNEAWSELVRRSSIDNLVERVTDLEIMLSRLQSFVSAQAENNALDIAKIKSYLRTLGIIWETNRADL